MSASVVKLSRKIKIKSTNPEKTVYLKVSKGSLILNAVEIDGISTHINNAKEFKLDSSSIY